jgi:hypothetical protein
MAVFNSKPLVYQRVYHMTSLCHTNCSFQYKLESIGLPLSGEPFNIRPWTYPQVYPECFFVSLPKSKNYRYKLVKYNTYIYTYTV